MRWERVQSLRLAIPHMRLYRCGVTRVPSATLARSIGSFFMFYPVPRRKLICSWKESVKWSCGRFTLLYNNVYAKQQTCCQFLLGMLQGST